MESQTLQRIRPAFSESEWGAFRIEVLNMWAKGEDRPVEAARLVETGLAVILSACTEQRP